MKEEIKKYFNIYNTINKLEKEKKETQNSFFESREILEGIKEKTEEERKEAIKTYNNFLEERNKKIQKLEKAIEEKEIEESLIYNNIVYLFCIKYHNTIINILDKYKDKNIGDNTKKKIQEEIKEALKKDNINSYIYLSFGDYYSSTKYKIEISIYKTEEEKTNFYTRNITFYFEICKYPQEEDQEKYGNYYLYRSKDYINILNNNILWENNFQYNYIEDPKKEAKEIIKTCKKKIEKVNKLIEEAKKIRKENCNILEMYKLKDYDYIYINHDQKLY